MTHYKDTSNRKRALTRVRKVKSSLNRYRAVHGPSVMPSALRAHEDYRLLWLTNVQSQVSLRSAARSRVPVGHRTAWQTGAKRLSGKNVLSSRGVHSTFCNTDLYTNICEPVSGRDHS